MGGMLAGHDQSGGEVMEKNGKKVIYHDRLIKFQREGGRGMRSFLECWSSSLGRESFKVLLWYDEILRYV